MKNVTKGERNGMIALALIALVIIGGAFLLRDMRSRQAGESVTVVTVMDTVSASRDNNLTEKSEKGKSRNGKRKKDRQYSSAPDSIANRKKTPGSSRRKGSSRVTEKATMPARDYLNDQIPLKGTSKGND